MFVRWFFRILLVVLSFSSLPASHSSAQSDDPVIITFRLEGTLHPAMMEHTERAMKLAEQEEAVAVILELDTPGGSIDLMNQLVMQIRASDIPVIVYVSPRGAMAASAGTIITLAGHISAMAPETTIGAASPVGSEGEDIGETMESKIKEMLRANVRTLTADRPADARDLAEDMVQNAKAVSVDEALEIGLIDYKAVNINDLLRQVDNHQVEINGDTVTLETTEAEIIPIERTIMEEILMVLASPNIAFLLLAIGVQAVLIELSSPGGWVAGFIGVVCLLLAIYGMGLLPVNWFGFLFFIVAFVLFILEIKTPTYGALTVAGVASFIVGALVLFNSPNVPSFQRASVPLIVSTGIVIGIIFFIIIGFALRAQKAPQRMGSLSLIGQVGLVNTPLAPTGTVQLGSELWTATLTDHESTARRGERVEVVSVNRLEILVKKIKQS